MEKYESYKKDELIEIAIKMGITSFPNAKVATRPTKEEIIFSINELEKQIENQSNENQSNENSENPENQFNEKVSKKQTLAQRRRSQLKKLMEMKRVQIDEVKSFQSYAENDSNRVEFVTWGNSLIGHHTTRIVFGTPWQVHVGALKNLEQNDAFGTVVDKNGAISNISSSRYRISYLPQLTKEEIDAIRRRQELRKIN